MKNALKNAVVAAVIALAATATSRASADEAAPAPAASASTPLQTRPSKALALAPTNEGTPFGYKLLVGGVVAVGAGLWLKKKGALAKVKDKKKRSAIDVLGRTSIGVRNELLVVDVEGTRLLIGMTPGSMQTLAVLQTPEHVVGEESPELPGEAKYAEAKYADLQAEPMVAARAKSLREQLDEPEDDAENEVEELSDRVRSLLDARKKRAGAPALPASEPRPRRVAQGTPKARVPGQAKGLLLSMEEARNDQEITKLGDW